MHEAQMHQANCFVTLTYDDEHLVGPSLDYRDFQLFMRRVRKLHRVRFFMAGEYGDRSLRPHFHACLFGVRFPESEFITRSRSGGPELGAGPHLLWRSSELEALWPHGFSSVGELTFQSAGYVARYCVKKSTNVDCRGRSVCVDRETGEVVDLVPEFSRCSLKPGIGATWYDKYQGEVFPHDRVVVAGKAAKPPKYYLQRLKLQDPVGFELNRLERLADRRDVGTLEDKRRLAAESEISAARCRSLRRVL